MSNVHVWVCHLLIAFMKHKHKRKSSYFLWASVFVLRAGNTAITHTHTHRMFVVANKNIDKTVTEMTEPTNHSTFPMCLLRWYFGWNDAVLIMQAHIICTKYATVGCSVYIFHRSHCWIIGKTSYTRNREQCKTSGSHLAKCNGHVPKIGLFSSINIADSINSKLMHFEMYVYALCILHLVVPSLVLLHQMVNVVQLCTITQNASVTISCSLEQRQRGWKTQHEINIRWTFVVGLSRINLHNITAWL